MHTLNEQNRRDLIFDYWIRHQRCSKYQVAQYFKELGLADRTVYEVLKNFEERESSERLSGSGKVAEKMLPQKVKKMINEMTSASNPCSTRSLAEKYDISKSSVNKIALTHYVKAYKKEKRPCYTEKQLEVQQTRISNLRSLLQTNQSPMVIMDDESYFLLRHNSLPGNSYYYAKSRGDAPDNLRFADTKKYEEKLLVWVAISENGISEAFFQPSGLAINKEIYSNECVVKRLKPFIDSHHLDGNYVFWPDLASAHYARLTLETYDSLGIKYVTREMNPPNVPQLRPIEDFWGWLKKEVYQNNWQAHSHRQLKQRIKLCLSRMDREIITKMMRNIANLLQKAANEGVDSVLH